MIKKVAVFNDLSGFGRCSLTAAIPILSALGIQCNPIPTMVLTGQGGYPVTFCRDLTDMLSDYTTAWKANHAEFEGIYTGYLTGSKQISYVFDFLEVFRTEHTFLLVDPVMGDNARTYRIFSEELLTSMKQLSRKANLITPNLTEACLLSDTPFEEVFELQEKTVVLEKVKQIGETLRTYAECTQDVIITGVKIQENTQSFIYNVAVTNKGTYMFTSHLFDKSFSGTGDLFASAMCGLRLNGYSTQEAMNIAGNFLYHSISDTMNEFTDGNDGIFFEKHLSELIPYGCR
ncbi:MAG: pyridoxamine kinase [Lachnospiraceae bacterium]|nr:pyridoxamine kinase [Lachnospiraceae bacterium]